MLVKKEHRKRINEEGPSSCALITVLSQVKVTAGRMGLDAAWYNDLLLVWGFFVTDGTWRLFSGECDCKKSSQRGMEKFLERN